MTATRKPVKPKRTIRLIRPETGSNPALILIRTPRKEARYEVREIESEIGGRGFLVKEVGTKDAEQYQCLAAGDDTLCSCRGFLRWNKCKHVEGLFALIMRGKI